MADSTIKHRSVIGSKLTLVLCACDSNALGSEMTPILAVLAMAFPGQDVSILVALPPLFVIPSTFIAAWLARRISRKTILTVGQILFIIGGLGGAFVETFEALVATRVFFGVGCGLVYTTVPTLIAYFYKGNERAKMMGFANAMGSILAMVFSVISGTLAVIGWHFPFYVNFFFVAVLIMQLVFLPKVPPENDTDTVKQAASLTPEQRRFGQRAWMCILLMFVTFTIGMVYLIRLAMFMEQTGIGDSVMAGYANAASTGCALVVSICFPYVFKKLGRYTVMVAMCAAALTYGCLAFATSPVGLFAGCFIWGFYLGNIIPYLQTSVSGTVHPFRRTWALAILSTALFAGEACATPYANLISAIVGPDIQLLFRVMTVMFLVLAVIVLIYLLATRKNAEYPYADVTE